MAKSSQNDRSAAADPAQRDVLAAGDIAIRLSSVVAMLRSRGQLAIWTVAGPLPETLSGADAQQAWAAFTAADGGGREK